MISSVSLDHLEQAWQTLMPARPEGQPKGKARWNDGASRDFTRDCGELATLIVQSIDSEFSVPPMGHATLRLAIVMHHAFKAAGLALAPLAATDIHAILADEEVWRARSETMPSAMLKQAEDDRIKGMPNHEILVALIGFLMDTQQARGAQPTDATLQDIGVASHLLQITLTALNLAASRAPENARPTA